MAQMNDASDDEISQALSLAAHHFKARFGGDTLVAALTEIIAHNGFDVDLSKTEARPEHDAK